MSTDTDIIEAIVDAKKLLRLPPFENFEQPNIFDATCRGRWGAELWDQTVAQVKEKFKDYIAEREIKSTPEEATRAQAEAVIEAWRAKREERLAAEKAASLLKEQEMSYKNWLIEVFLKQRFEGMVLGGKVTGLTTKEVPTVFDKDAFCNYILETEQLDLLQFRISTSAIKEREDAGLEIPGISHVETYDLFNRKA